jgi:hypothetical protein
MFTSLKHQLKKETKNEKISKDTLINLLQDHQARFYHFNLKLDEIVTAFEKEIEEYDENDECVHLTDRIIHNFDQFKHVEFAGKHRVTIQEISRR